MKYLIVDIANQLNCNSFVRAEPELVPVAAITITMNNIVKLFDQYKCNHVVICCEGGSWRKIIYPEYKANRTVKKLLQTEKEKETSRFFFDETDKFINFIQEKTNATVLKAPGVEGDDFVARWIDTHPNDEHIILSNDSDFIQLLSDNVEIYNPSDKYLLSKNFALDDDGSIAYVERIITEEKNGVKVKMKKSFPVSVPNPEYELFKKCIRGDSGDNIMSAYPRCSEKGTKNKIGIIGAFEDRHDKGIQWNMFMLHEWEKVVGKKEDGTPILKKVRVLDEYNRNVELINLRNQPEEIINLMDETIKLEENKQRRFSVGFDLIRICNDLGLGKIQQNVTEYARPLNYGAKQDGSKVIKLNG